MTRTNIGNATIFPVKNLNELSSKHVHMYMYINTLRSFVQAPLGFDGVEQRLEEWMIRTLVACYNVACVLKSVKWSVMSSNLFVCRDYAFVPP